MTDKQIIKVDSLDELYITQLQEQLKRKEQECERLKQLNCIYSIGVKQAKELKETLDHKQAYINNVENYNEQLNEQLDQLKMDKEELNKQLQSTKGLVTVGNKQLLDAINAYITVRTTLEDVKIMLQVVTETNNVYPLQTNLLLMLEKISEVIPDEKSLKMECNNE